MKRKLFIVMTVGMIILFTIMPSVVSEGAKDGLLLWFMAIVPSLLPFMILSGILVKLKTTKYINRFLRPLFGLVFGVSDGGSYPILIGFLAGCPIGAKTAAQLYKDGEIKREEAQYLMMFCNNLSPMFLIEFIGVKCLDVKNPFLIFVVVAGSAVINAWVVRKSLLSDQVTGVNSNRKSLMARKKTVRGSADKKQGVNAYKNGSDGKSFNVWKKLSYKKAERIGESVKGEKNINVGKKLSSRKDERSRENVKTEKNYPVMDAVDESIADSCETILKIGGYIILFSIITSIIEYIIPEKYDVAGCIAAGITEVSTGAMQLAGNEWLSGIRVIMTDAKTIVTVWLCAFGGISSVAQTYSVLSGTDLSIKKYVIAKIRQGFIAVILALLVFRI